MKKISFILAIVLYFISCNGNNNNKFQDGISGSNQEAFNYRYKNIDSSRIIAKKVIVVLDSLKKDLPDDYYYNEMAKALNTLSYSYFLMSNFDSARICIRKVLDIRNDFSNKKVERAISLSIVARLLLRECKYEDVFKMYNDTISYYNSFLTLPARDKERYYWGESEYLLGNLILRYYYRNGENLENIKPYIQKAERDTMYIDPTQKLSLYYTIAGTYSRFIKSSDTLNLVKALEYLQKGFTLLSNPGIENNYFLANYYQMLGEILSNDSTKLVEKSKDSIIIYSRVEEIKKNKYFTDWDKKQMERDSFPLYLFEKARRLFLDYKDPYQNISSEIPIAAYYLNSKDTINARIHYQNCIKQVVELTDTVPLGKWKYKVYEGALETMTNDNSSEEVKGWFDIYSSELNNIFKNEKDDYIAQMERDNQKVRLRSLSSILAAFGVLLIFAVFVHRKDKKVQSKLELAKTSLEVANKTGLKIIASQKNIETLNTKIAMKKLITGIYAEFCKLFEMDILNVGLLDKKNDKLFIYSLKNENEISYKDYSLRADNNVAEVACIKDGREINSDNYRNENGDAISIACVPLYDETEGKRKENPIGIISIRSSKEKTFSDHDKLLLSNISLPLAIVINNMSYMINMIEDKMIADTCISIMNHQIAPHLRNFFPDSLKMLRDDILNNSPDTLQKAEHAIKVSNRLRRIFNIIFSKMENLSVNKIPFECSIFNIQDIFDALQENNYPMLFFKPAVYKVEADKVQIELLLQNLIENAIEAIKKTTDGRIEISASEYNEQFIKISVKDNGIGIAPDRIDGLFDMENDVIIKTKPAGKLGFGLVLCRYIINEHDTNTNRGCKIWAESAEGQGSSFYFTLAKR